MTTPLVITPVNKQFWQNLSVKTQVVLTDAAALEASQAQGRGMEGMEYVIEEITHVVEKDSLCEWFFCRMANPDQELFLSAKIIDDEVQLRVYYIPPAVIVGTRKEQIAANNTFLFKEAKDWHQYLKLQHASSILWEFDIPGQAQQQVSFAQKGGMELTGRAYIKPSKATNVLLATISEYTTDTAISDPDIAIVEIGDMNSKVGGVMKILLGGPINQFEVNFLRSKSPAVSGSKPSSRR